MQTIIELFDKEPIRNILAATLLKPERVVFLGQKDMDKDRILNFFHHMKLNVEVEFIYVEPNMEYIFQTLEGLYKKYPDSSINITGGSNLELIAAGRISQKYDMPLFYYNAEKNVFINIRNSSQIETRECRVQFDVEDFFVMAGASLNGHGHISIENMTQETMQDISSLWSIFIENTYNWRNFINYFQTLTSEASKTLSKNSSSLEETIFTNKLFVKEMLKRLYGEGLVKNLTIKGSKINFTYKNYIIKKSINDVGTILELFIYMTANKMNYFDSIEISAILDWNGINEEIYNVQNEIDVVLTKGIHPIFISCKSGKPTAKDLGELHTLVEKFGGEHARGIIATTTNFSGFSTAIYKRALDLGLYVIEKDDIVKNNLENILKEVASI